MKEVFIVNAKRTAVGGFLGALSNYTAPQLASLVIRDLFYGISLDPASIDAVYIGNVLSANMGQSPARQAALLAGLSLQTDCTTINKVCSSGLKAVIIGAQQIQLGIDDLVVSGGMESMSNVPHYSFRRKSNKMGDEQLVDGLLKDGLTDAIDHYHMGKAAELCARKFNISRNDQDEYALESYARANNATNLEKFSHEITALTIKEKSHEIIFDKDEDITKIIPEKLALLKPVFEVDGTVTAANASNLSDGAAMILLASREAVEKYNLKPLAKIIAYADAALAPQDFTTAPSVAITKALKRAGLILEDISFLEINEAYAAVMIANKKLLDLDMNKVNIYGGAIAIGHPLGASGARILCTLTAVLRQENGKYGVAAMCNGGGGATALIIENLV